MCYFKTMPTVNQLVKKGRTKRTRKSKTQALRRGYTVDYITKYMSP